MIEKIYLIFQIQLVFLIISLLVFTVYSIIEHEKTAVKKGLFLFVLIFPIISIHSINIIPFFIQLTFIVIFSTCFIIIFLPFGNKPVSFSTVKLLQPMVEKSGHKKKSVEYTESEITGFIKNWTLKLGAENVGVTLLKQHHIYSHIGRGEDYGKVVELNHKYAIAFTVEMIH